MNPQIDLNKVEISREALTNNIRTFRSLVGDKILCPCVKANAYGHGLVECSRIFLEAGADWLSVNSLYEAVTLRDAGIDSPIYVLGYIPLDFLKKAVDLDLRMVVYNRETVEKLGGIGKKVRIHLKVETGNNRQGIDIDKLVDFAKFANGFENIELEGLSTHFANIEDTTNHDFAGKQLVRFIEACKILDIAGIKIPIRHCANSAATILFPETHFELVRVGIAAYGMWPSNETYVSFVQKQREDSSPLRDLSLKPAFKWTSKIVQLKDISEGEYIGYGCTYRTTRKTRVAVIGTGYYDGYDRGVSNKAHVVVNGKRAPVLGRVCMNLIMADVSDVPAVSVEDDVVLIGTDGEETVSAELFAGWAGTINYEVTSRVNDRIPRIVVL